MIGDIANTTSVDAVLASEEHQHVTIDRRAADGAALEVAFGLKELPDHHTAGLLIPNKAAERSIIERRFRLGGPEIRRYPLPTCLLLLPAAATNLAR